jgi:hypothetical protein
VRDEVRDEDRDDAQIPFLYHHLALGHFRSLSPRAHQRAASPYHQIAFSIICWRCQYGRASLARVLHQLFHLSQHCRNLVGGLSSDRFQLLDILEVGNLIGWMSAHLRLVQRSEVQHLVYCT